MAFADRMEWPPMLRCVNRILTDDILLEIFYRLPCGESVTQCKCVCKRWYNLISSPDFVAHFIAHKLHYRSWVSSNRVVSDPPSAFFIRLYNKNQNDIVYPLNHPSTPPRSSLSFIPCYKDGSKESILVDRAFCRDLVLCDNRCSKEPDFYIYNPRTKQWFQLPPPPCTRIAEKREGRLMPGFICDPYYYFNNQMGNASVSFNSCYRYAVCLFLSEEYHPRTQMDMQIFSSETRSWRNVILLSPEEFNFLEAANTGWVTYNGILLLYNLDSLICFDPYKVTQGDRAGVNVILGHFIRMPPFALSWPQCLPTLCLGVFGERILIVQCSAPLVRRGEEISIAEVDNNYKIWELKNYDTGEWLLERTILVRDLVSEDCTLDQQIKNQCPNTVVICFHPYNPDIVLLGMRTLPTAQPNLIVEFNLREKTLKTVCNIDRWKISNIFTHTWWPTPVPQNF